MINTVPAIFRRFRALNPANTRTLFSSSFLSLAAATMSTAPGAQTMQYWVDALKMDAHPEGGYFREVCMGGYMVNNEQRSRRHSYSTIYFLLTPESPSHLHRLCSDESWFFHAGDPLLVHCIFKTVASMNVDAIGNTNEPHITTAPETPGAEGEKLYAEYRCVPVGPNVHEGEVLQYTVPGGAIFGSSVAPGGKHGYSLVSCVVSPGFDYKDFELFNQDELMAICPQHEAVIREIGYVSKENRQ